MRILFLGDVVGNSGCSKIMNNLLNQIELKKIDFVIVNGENADQSGVGLSKKICEDFFNCGGFIEFSSEMTSVEISSPKDYSGYNGHYTYPFNSLCEWVIKDECAEGFYINPIKFDIEGNDEKIRKELHFYSLKGVHNGWVRVTITH